MTGQKKAIWTDYLCLSYGSCAIVCLSVILLFSSVLGAPLRAQASAPPELEKAVNKLRTLYQDMYPRFQDIKNYRDSGRTDRAEEVASELRSEINDRLNRIKRHLNSVEPENRSVKKRVRNVKSVLKYFNQYQKKFLSNWEPENPQLLKAFNKQELIQRGIASPEMLRKKFLTDLTGMMLTEGYVSENVVSKNLDSYAEQVQRIYRDVLSTLLGLLNRIDRARNNEEKDVKEVIQKANREWAEFWEDYKKERTTLRNKINRTLILYRDRSHLTSFQQIRFEKGIRLKREFNEIMEFQSSVSADNLFGNQNAIHKLLVLMGKKYGKRLLSLLNENTPTHLSMVQKFIQNSDRLESVSSKSEYEDVLSTVDQWLEEAVYGEFDLDQAVERIRKVPVQELSSLVRRLRTNYGKKEKQFGSVINDLRAYTIDFFEFSKTARQIPEQFVKRFKQVSFESKQQFQSAFPGPLTEKIESLNQKQQEMARRLSKLENRFKSTLETHFSQEKGEKSAARQ